MNKNTNKWAVEVGNANLSEAIQLVAFSYGYKWSAAWDQAVEQTSAKFLLFNPTGKIITYSNYRYEVEDATCQLVNTFDAVMSLLKTPPVVSLSVGLDITVNKAGDVALKSWTVGSDLFDRLVRERNTFLGKKAKLPVVSFTYTSQSSGRKVRNVMVTEMTEDSIKGLDMDDGNKFKQFLTGKVSGKVELVSFVDEP